MVPSRLGSPRRQAYSVALAVAWVAWLGPRWPTGGWTPAAAQARPLVSEAPLADEALASWLDEQLGASRPPRRPTLASKRRAQRVAEVLRARVRAPAAAATDAPDARAPSLPRASHRCALGVALAHAGELGIARRHLAACEQTAVATTLAERGAAARSVVDPLLRASALAPFDVSAELSGWVAAASDAPDALCPLPCTLWLADGTHRLRAAASARALSEPASATVLERELVAAGGKRGSLLLPAPPPPASGPGVGKVDLSDDNLLEAPTTGPPPPGPHRSMLPAKYRRGVGANAAPLELGPARGALLLLAGAGLDGDGYSVARVAAHGRAALGPWLALEAGLDLGYRADDAGDHPRRAGAAALVGARVAAWPDGPLTVLVAARGRVGQRDGDAAMTGGALLQLAVRPRAEWPIVAGLEVELEPAWRAASAFVGAELIRR